MIINPHMNPTEYPTPDYFNMDSFPIYVEVTEELIKMGCKSQASYCPIALAIKEALSKLGFVGSGVQVIRRAVLRVYKDDPNSLDEFTKYQRFIGNLPETAHRFIYHFDNGESVVPFNFILTLAKSYL